LNDRNKIHNEENRHPYGVMRLNGNDVAVDEELVPLVKALNDVGLRTTQCCQGYPGQDAYISITLDDITDVAIRQHGLYGKRLVIWWDKRKASRPNHKEIAHSAVDKLEKGEMQEGFGQ